MAVTQTTTLRNAKATAVATTVDGGANPGGLRLWTGTDGDGTQLAAFTFSATAFTGPSTGVLTLDDVPIAATGAADGTCQSADIVQDLAGTPVSLAVFDEGDELTLDNPVIASGQSLSLTSLTWTEPASDS